MNTIIFLHNYALSEEKAPGKAAPHVCIRSFSQSLLKLAQRTCLGSHAGVRLFVSWKPNISEQSASQHM